jgi:hypothetical protein
MGVARQAPATPTSHLVCDLKAERQDEGEDTFDKRLAVTKELEVGRFVLEIDGDGAVFSSRFGRWAHVSPPSPQVSLAEETQGRNTLKSQDNREGLRTLPRNAMECENDTAGEVIFTGG